MKYVHLDLDSETCGWNPSKARRNGKRFDVIRKFLCPAELTNPSIAFFSFLQQLIIQIHFKLHSNPCMLLPFQTMVYTLPYTNNKFSKCSPTSASPTEPQERAKLPACLAFSKHQYQKVALQSDILDSDFLSPPENAI